MTASIRIDPAFHIGWENSADLRYFVTVCEREDMRGVIHHRARVLRTLYRYRGSF